MLQETKYPLARKALVLFLACIIVLTYLPKEAFSATKASVYDGGILVGSDGKNYYPNSKNGGYYWAKFSNREGTGFVYRQARAFSAKKSIVVDTGKGKYQGYCLEHGAWMNAGATGYSAKEQENLMELNWMKPYSKETICGMRLALLFGKQPGMTQKDVPVAGCNLDDWYWATQNIIWEFQQGLRTSVTSGLKSRVGTYSMNANWFKDTVKDRPAEKMYNWMLSQMKKYYGIPSFTSAEKEKVIKRPAVVLTENQDGTWSGTIKDAQAIKQDLKAENKHVKITRSENTYTITSDVAPEALPEAIKAVKDLDISVPKKELLVYTTTQSSPVADSNHLQSVALGADDPVYMYFRVAKGDVPEEGAPGEPQLPSFLLDVEKVDLNPGFDQAAGTSHTGMGDASLDARIDLLVDGEAIDSRQLDIYGYSDEPFYFMPWSEVSELTKTSTPVYDPDSGALLYTEHYWRGSKTVKTVEQILPDGRFSEIESATGTGERDHGTIVYYAHCRDNGPIDYKITYENGTLTEAEEISAENPQPMKADTGENAYVNDNFRGRLQIIKTKTDLDPFTQNGSGVTGSEGSSSSTGGGSEGTSAGKYSVNSKWTIRLSSGGYEGNPYIRVKPLQQGEEGYSPFANNYKVSRDNSGILADQNNPLTVSKYGQINIVDLPYGLYTVEEIAADSNGYVLETFEVQVTEDGQLISTDTNNVPKKNKVQIIKTNSETGKTVRLDENAAFRIKYLGNPDSENPTDDKNYGRYLPNGASYTDGDEAGKNNYIFKCNKNGQIVLPYQLEYGTYQLEEVTVPEGYFVGSYDESGVGTSTDMPKKFEDAVVIYDASGKKVTDFSNNKKIIFNKYKFTVSEQTPHQDGQNYITYYLTVNIPNNPVKGEVEITKSGESLAGWISKSFDSSKGYEAVWDKNLLENAVFNVYAAEDVYQADGVQPIRAYMAEDDAEIELEEVTRNHSKVDEAKSFWQKLLETGEKILRFLGLDKGDQNQCKTEYVTKAEKGATYSTSYSFHENGITTKYNVEYRFNYTKGGMNYTDIHVKKDMEADGYVAAFDVSEPVLKTGTNQVDILNLILPNENRIRLNNAIVEAYGKDDVLAEVIEPAEDFEPIEIPEGYTRVSREDMYLIEASIEGKNLYQVWAMENGVPMWIPCDESGKFYKSYHQEYDFTTVQHFNTNEGFTFSFDGFQVSSACSNLEQTAESSVISPSGCTAKIDASKAYSYQTLDGVTTFLAAPQNTSPVYFKVNSGIKTSMIYQSGHTVTTVEVKQSQLYQFGENSENGGSTEKIYPTVEYDGEMIDWCRNLKPEEETFEQILDADNYIRAQRKEVGPENKEEVTYEITLVSNNSTVNKGFIVTCPDSTQINPCIGTDEGEEAGKLIFTSIEGTMVHPLGSPVATIKTDENGIASTPNLPLGTYYIQEVSSGNGHINEGSWRIVELTYKDQYTPLIWDSEAFSNEAVSVRIDLTKLLETSYKSKEYEPGGVAVFGVFSAEKISAVTTTNKEIDKKNIEADTLVGTIHVHSDGSGSLTAKLPQGRYYIKELSAPTGYKLNGTKYYFDAVDVLTADQCEFSYDAIGVSGYLTQDGNENTIIKIESLYSKPMNGLIVDGVQFDLLQSEKNKNVTIEKLQGRTRTSVQIAAGNESVISFANGSTLHVYAEKGGYKAVFDGAQKPVLKLGSETNLIKQEDANKIQVLYEPKVTKTAFLGEMTFDYVAPKPDPLLSEADKAKVTNFLLTSPEGTSSVKAVVNYDYSSARLTFTGQVGSITKDGENQQIEEILVLERNDDKPVNAVVNFEDGVSFTIGFDETGNFFMSDSGMVEKNLDVESTLETDGDTSRLGPVSFKNTTAKTYARNNTDAGVLNIRISSIKNDRLPGEPNIPVIPGPSTPNPSIKTSAKDSETGEHIAKADQKVTLIDTVEYRNLTIGKKYTLKGTLMNRETGKPIVINGKEVSAEKEFIPEKADGSISLTFEFEGSTLLGKTTVIFEKLFVDGLEIAAHEDLRDEKQTIYFPEIRTSASHKETNRLQDVVTYKNLIAGKTYCVQGILVDKESGKPVLSGGKKITAKESFVPETSDGSISLAFHFEEADLYGKTVVVYEEVFLENVMIGEHKDLHDQKQTVAFEKPEVEKPKTPEEDEQKTPATGDEHNLALYFMLLLLAGSGMGLGVKKIEKKKNSEKRD